MFLISILGENKPLETPNWSSSPEPTCGAAKLDPFKAPERNLQDFNSLILLDLDRAEHAAETGNNSLC